MTFSTYDAMAGPDLDRSLWSDYELDGTPRIEPGAVTTVADGGVSVDIPELTRGDLTVQGLDDTEHLVVSTRSSRLSATGASRFAVDVPVDHVGMEDDYRLGLTSSNVIGAGRGAGRRRPGGLGADSRPWTRQGGLERARSVPDADRSVDRCAPVRSRRRRDGARRA